MSQDPEKAKEALNKELQAYKKLERINKSDEFNDFFAFQVDDVAKKMVDLFSGKGPADWDEFCRARGEIVAVLYPIQQIRGANYVIKQISEQLSAYYNNPVDL